MRKSIYEETLNLIENIDRNLPYTWAMGRDNLMKIKQALEQAKKQEKLLELYKEVMSYADIPFEYIARAMEIKKQIKELENE